MRGIAVCLVSLALALPAATSGSAGTASLHAAPVPLRAVGASASGSPRAAASGASRRATGDRKKSSEPGSAAPDEAVTRSATPAGAAFRDVPGLEAGYRLLYQQEFSLARARFSAWSRGHPGDPFGDASLAAAFLFEEFYRQGVMTSDYFLDDARFLRGIDGRPDAARMDGFRQALARARETAGRRLKRDPEDPDALFALTLCAGMESNALSILERRNFDGLRRLKQANDYARRLLAVKPDAADAWLALGSANYVIGCLPATVRFFLWFGGIHGDRALGMRQLGKTAEGGRYLRPYAKILLALAARRERQDPLARRLLGELTRSFPGSPLFASEYARVASHAVLEGSR